VNMFLALFLLSTMVTTYQAMSSSSCSCVNPLASSESIQEFAGEKDIICQYTGSCFVPCDAACSDLKNTTGFFETLGYCTSEIACTVSEDQEKPASAPGVDDKIDEYEDDEAEKSLLDKLLPALEGTQIDASADMVLASRGTASEYQGSTLGLYQLLPDSQVYHQAGGDYYLHQDHDKWYLSPHITGCDKSSPLACAATWVASIKTTDIKSEGQAWSYGRDGDWVSDDSTLQFVSVSSPAVSCLSCKSIVLTSTGPAKLSKPGYLGVFDIVPGKYSAGRPVYKNYHGHFLMVKNEFTTYGVWDDAELRLRAGKGDAGVRGVRSGAAPTCVTDINEKPAGKLGYKWQFIEGEDWQEDDAVIARCLD